MRCHHRVGSHLEAGGCFRLDGIEGWGRLGEGEGQEDGEACESWVHLAEGKGRRAVRREKRTKDWGRGKEGGSRVGKRLAQSIGIVVPQAPTECPERLGRWIGSEAVKAVERSRKKTAVTQIGRAHV